MSKRIIPITQKTCTNSLGTYYRAMETENFVYFVNFEESDENGQVKMYRKSAYKTLPNKVLYRLELVSDNYFAHVGLMEDLKDCAETWMSPRMKKERALYVKEEILPKVEEYLKLSDKGITSIFHPDGKRFNELEQELDEYYVTLPDEDVGAFLSEKYSELLTK